MKNVFLYILVLFLTLFAIYPANAQKVQDNTFNIALNGKMFFLEKSEVKVGLKMKNNKSYFLYPEGRLVYTSPRGQFISQDQPIVKIIRKNKTFYFENLEGNQWKNMTLMCDDKNFACKYTINEKGIQKSP